MNKQEIMELVDEFGRLCVVRGWDTEEAVKARAAIEAALPDVPEHCVICGSSEPFAGSCGGGRLNQAALCYQRIHAMLSAAPEPAQAEQPRNEPVQQEQIKELEEMNAQLREQNDMVGQACAALERQLVGWSETVARADARISALNEENVRLERRLAAMKVSQPSTEHLWDGSPKPNYRITE
jgi:hypothetical protein